MPLMREQAGQLVRYMQKIQVINSQVPMNKLKIVFKLI